MEITYNIRRAFEGRISAGSAILAGRIGRNVPVTVNMNWSRRHGN